MKLQKLGVLWCDWGTGHGTEGSAKSDHLKQADKSKLPRGAKSFEHLQHEDVLELLFG